MSKLDGSQLSLCQQTGLPLGTVLKQPLMEFYYKNDRLGDPLLMRDRLLLLELATSEQVEQKFEFKTQNYSS